MRQIVSGIGWKSLLPTTMLVLALACHVYAPHVFRVEAHRQQKEVTSEYYLQHNPAWPIRVSRGISFPAFVLACPLKGAQVAIFAINGEYTNISINLYDLVFFFGVVLLWHWVGRTLDKGNWQATRPAWSRTTRITGYLGGLAFGIVTGIYADREIAANALPSRQVGVAGVGWACLLIAYFIWKLAREVSTETVGKRWLLASTGAFFTLGALWVGGPFGATQALGEYLRPTTIKRMPLSMLHCTANEPLPGKLVRVVEAERSAYHLTLQTVTVCTAEVAFSPREGWISDVLSAQYGGGWPPLRAGCCTYQYRRHVAVFAADVSGNRLLIVQADLIQSRWDYLRLNWNKLRGAWSWPYPKVLFGT